VGTITARKRRNGVMYTAQIRLMRDGKIVHSESQTFEKKSFAKQWLLVRETELNAPGALAQETGPALRVAIEKYVEEHEKKMGRTKAQCLRTLAASSLGDLSCAKVDSVAITTWAKALDCQPSTRENYLSHLAAVAAVAKLMWGYPLDKQAIADARTVLRRMGITTRSRERDRRPTRDEIDALIEHFKCSWDRGDMRIPMADIVLFAIFSARRQEEIARICWADVDHDRVLVRDMKHPGQKIGNDVICDLPPEAVAVLSRQPRVAERVFPFNHRSISAAFTRGCQFLQIDDLHFHDLRHEGASRLFEMGWTIPHVAAVTGHRSWNSLKRYAHLRHSGDRWVDWKWNPITPPLPLPASD